MTSSAMNSTRQVAVITGACRGIGAAIAIALAENGFNILANSRCEEDNAKPVMEKIRTLCTDAVYCQADISKRHDRLKILQSLKEEFGRVDLLVNNAGVPPLVREDILRATEESYDRVLEINLKGPYFLTQLISNWMIELKQANIVQNPKIVVISSLNAYTSSTSRGEYCISKAGLSMMTKLYADRLSEYGINVYEIRPGIIMSDMTAPVKEKYYKLIEAGVTPIKRWGRPEDIARAVVAIARDHFPFSTGQVFNVDGGFHLRRL